MKNLLRVVSKTSFSVVYYYLSSPSLLVAKLQSPAPSSLTEIALALFKGSDVREVEEYRLQLLRNHHFFEQLNENMIAKRSRRSNPADWLQLIYVLCRLKKPEIIVETGVFDGESSAVFLQALRDNGKGRLISIDLPATETIDGSTQCMRETTLPPGCQPGWVIPQYLKQRHELLLGDSKQLLPQVFEQHPQIDIFMHDSLHTFEHQRFEYEAAWPHLSSGGILLSDDIFWNAAFHQFCKEKSHNYKHLAGFGVML